MNLLLLCALSFQVAQAKTQVEWQKSALRLSGESDRVYREAVVNLNAVPGLDEKLIQALHTDQTETFLALDVISTLKKDSLLPYVLKEAERDQTGFFYLAINTFIDEKHLKLISDFYSSQLQNSQVGSPVKIVLLDTLARLKFKISEHALKNFLNDDSEPEVRSAALSYLRAFWLRDPHHPFCESCVAPRKIADPQYDSLLVELSKKQAEK